VQSLLLRAFVAALGTLSLEDAPLPLIVFEGAPKIGSPGTHKEMRRRRRRRRRRRKVYSKLTQ